MTEPASDPFEFGDLSRYLDPDWHPKINDKVYDVKCPGGRLGLRVRMIFAKKAKLTDQQELDLMAEVMGETKVEPTDEELAALDELDEFWPYRGGVFSQMWEDGVPWPMMIHAGRTALILFGNGSRELARAYWRRLGQGDDVDPKLPPRPRTKAQKAT